MKTALLWLVGGLLVGSGIALAATGGFGMAEGPTALFAAGVACMVGANAGAWKQTGGY